MIAPSPGRVHSPAAGVFVVGLGASLASMDVAVNVAFPAITAAFALDLAAIRWVVVYYVVTYACLLLAFGHLGDRIGHRRVFRAGLLASVAAFAMCAAARDYPALLIARIGQGVSTALLLSCAPALATACFAPAGRTRALGLYGGVSAFAGTVAPVIGGACILLLGWSGVFWMRVPVALLALLLLPLLPEDRVRAPSTPHHPADPLGPVLLAVSIATLLLAPTTLNSTAPGWVAAMLGAGGLAALAAFAVHQRHAREPVFPASVARDPGFVAQNLASVAVHFVAFAVPLLVPYYLARIAGQDAGRIGMALALSPVGMLLGSMLAPALARARGARATALAGGLGVAAGGLMIAMGSGSPALAPILAGLLVNGFGLGLFQVAYTDIIVAVLPEESRGVAGSLSMVTRTIGVVGAASALTAVLGLLERGRLATGDDAGTAYVNAFGTVFLGASTALGALGVLGCLGAHAWSRRTGPHREPAHPDRGAGPR